MATSFDLVLNSDGEQPPYGGHKKESPDLVVFTLFKKTSLGLTCTSFMVSEQCICRSLVSPYYSPCIEHGESPWTVQETGEIVRATLDNSDLEKNVRVT